MEINSSRSGLSGNNSSPDNTLQINLEKNSLENQTLSNITPKYNSLDSEMTIIKAIKNEIKNIRIAYPNKDEIPLINIKDENCFESGERIENYIDTLILYDDSKFNKCALCKEGKNKYFCEDCYKNICDICYKNCMLNHHILINLSEKLNQITNYISIIRTIIENFFLGFKTMENNDEIIKRNNNYDFIDEYEMNIEIKEKTKDYTYDIILIEAIIEKNYINYFHYINVEECFYYVLEKYCINAKLNLKSEKIDFEENSDDINSYIIIRYKIENGLKKIKIFGKNFYKKYKNICKIIYEGKKYKLTEYFKIKNSNKNILEIRLSVINNIDDISYMFDDCSSLISIQDISKLDTNKIINMSKMFCNCSSLIALPDISKWKTNNVKDMCGMFYNCSSLIALPDISNWNTNNVKDMNDMFYNCSSLVSLPGISKWNTHKVKDMSGMFEGCSSLVSLPDISKWTTNKVKDMSSIFRNCLLLISLPDISKWSTYKVKDMSEMFEGCSSLIKLPDISKWEMDNVNYINNMFNSCSSLVSLPNISKWKINNVKDISKIFNSCTSLVSLPDISK